MLPCKPTPQLPPSEIIAILGDFTWLTSAIVRHPFPRLLSAFLRHQDTIARNPTANTHPPTNPDLDGEGYLFLDEPKDGGGADSIAAFAVYVHDLHQRHAKGDLQSVSAVPGELRSQASFCGFQQPAVMYDHTLRQQADYV
ncbi:MAG: hypothetical protein WDW36_009012 [Sanguina aurantia]